jgi:hypothetical protein
MKTIITICERQDGSRKVVAHTPMSKDEAYDYLIETACAIMGKSVGEQSRVDDLMKLFMGGLKK